MKLPLFPFLAATLLACGGEPFTLDTPLFVLGTGSADASPPTDEAGVVPFDATSDSEPATFPEASPHEDADLPDAWTGVDARSDASEPHDAAPDADACVLTERSNGEGTIFASCDPAGVYSRSSALEACEAYAGAHGQSASDCADITCGGLGDGIRDLPGGACASGDLCWGYDDSGAGKVTECTACAAAVGGW